MDDNTYKIVSLVLTGVLIPIVTIASIWFKSRMDAQARSMEAQDKAISDIKHATDGLTEKLVGAAADKAGLLATAAEKVAQEDREMQQAKGAAAARQADAGAKVSTPLAMASPMPTTPTAAPATPPPTSHTP